MRGVKNGGWWGFLFVMENKLNDKRLMIVNRSSQNEITNQNTLMEKTSISKY